MEKVKTLPQYPVTNVKPLPQSPSQMLQHTVPGWVTPGWQVAAHAELHWKQLYQPLYRCAVWVLVLRLLTVH